LNYDKRDVVKEEKVEKMERGLAGGMLRSQTFKREISKVVNYIVEAFASNL
jgi:hypothetical protein